MASEVPRAFPNVVCWNRQTRSEVMNTIALDVRDSVFKATHFPSFLQQEGAARGTFVPVTEARFLEDFLSADHSHVFDIVVGDTGVGKSHLIRWMLYEINRRNESQARWWVVDVPRSSANLTDVVRRILKGFEGSTVKRLMGELDKHNRLPLDEAKDRVLDELAIVLSRKSSEFIGAKQKLTGIQDQILELLPVLLRANELRVSLKDRATGVVTRLAEHVLGRRVHRQDDQAAVRWKSEDLRFRPIDCKRVGGDAGELAAMLLDDDNAREIATELVNRALPDALKGLLRFRSGDMKNAVAEIRRELLTQGKELLLLVEDLSVTEGLDAELIEALQVRPHETGEELCKLRSVVGLTHDDFARMRENIAVGRTLRTIYFNVPVGDYNRDKEGVVGPQAMLDFASRYLNAARYSLTELDQWAANGGEAGVSSFCEHCPNRSPCHTSFGAVDGRGLYPFSPDTVFRLYHSVASSLGSDDKAFNPRIMVGRVLNTVLEEGKDRSSGTSFRAKRLCAHSILTRCALMFR